MSAPNRRHRRGNGMLGAHHEEGQEPRPISDNERDQEFKGSLIFGVVVIVGLAVGILWKKRRRMKSKGELV